MIKTKRETNLYAVLLCSCLLLRQNPGVTLGHGVPLLTLFIGLLLRIHPLCLSLLFGILPLLAPFRLQGFDLHAPFRLQGFVVHEKRFLHLLPLNYGISLRVHECVYDVCACV